MSPSTGTKRCLQHPYGRPPPRGAAGYQVSAAALHGEGSASPVLTHPPKSCPKEVGCSHRVFSLSWLIEGEAAAGCPVWAN